MAVNLANTPAAIEKLKGRENFDSWKFVVQAYFEVEGLWNCLEPEEKETDTAEKTAAEIKAAEAAEAAFKVLDRKARAKLILLVDPLVYVHIQSAKTSAEAWTAICDAYEDNGLTFRVSLLRKLITTKLSESDSVESYVNTILRTAHKLRSIGMDLSDEWVGTLLLAGLPDEYKPMIMGLESSGIKISADVIKTKLLQEVKKETSENDGSALFGKQKSAHKRNVRCFNCKQLGHYARECTQRKSMPQKANKNEKGNNVLLSSFTAVERFNENQWFIDSGASAHMTMRKDILIDARSSNENEVVVADGSRLKVNAVGDVKMCSTQRSDILVKNVQHVPNLCANLLSVNAMVNNGNTIIFDDKGCRIIDSAKQLVATASVNHGMYKLDSAKATCMSIGGGDSEKQRLWHKRLGHVGQTKLKTISSTELDFSYSDLGPCEICLKGKHARAPFNHVGTRSTELLDTIHSDVCGPMRMRSIGGARYFCTFTDDFSRKTFVYLLKEKSEVTDKFIEFKQWAENQTKKSIKTFRSDGGKEYVNQRMSDFLRKNGITHQTTVPHTPQQNGVSERVNRSIVEKARCLLFESGLSGGFWAEAVSTAVYIMNRLPSSGSVKSPHELWTGNKPNLKQLKVFGCKAMSHVPKANRGKFDPKSINCIMMGYSETVKAYRLYDPSKRKIIVSRDVVFFEDQRWNEKVIENSNDSNEVFIDFEQIQSADCEQANVLNESSVDHDQADISNTQSINDSARSDHTIQANDEQQDENIISSGDEDESDPVNKTIMTDDDSVTFSTPVNSPVSPIRNKLRVQERKNYACAVSQCEVGDPLTVESAMARHDARSWKQAMQSEINSLAENDTWEIVNLPPNRRPINCKWVFKVKRDAKGNIMKHKARLVVKGCSQREGIDYSETYAPVVRYNSIRLLLSIATNLDLQIDQMDVVTAFLHGDIEEEIYMVQPEAFNDGTERVCRLKKSLYGLKQASKAWYTKLNDAIVEFGLRRSNWDPCVYFKRDSNGKLIIVAVYVDDLLIFSNDNAMRRQLKQQLSTKFRMKDLGEVSSVLGLNVVRDRKRGTLSIDQHNYIDGMLKRFNMQESNPVTSPLDHNAKLSMEMCPKNDAERKQMENVPYRQAVGCIAHLAQVSRPDIAYALSVVSRFNNNPGQAHWTAVKRILRYLKGTSKAKLEFNRKGNNELVGFCDSDWAGDPDDAKSTTGFIFMLNNGPITWCARKQQTTAISTTEAEFMSLTEAIQETMWIRGIKDEILGRASQPTQINCDNKSAIAIASTAMFHHRTRHMNAKTGFVRENIEAKLIELNYVQTQEQSADVLTKALTPQRHSLIVSKCGIQLN